MLALRDNINSKEVKRAHFEGALKIVKASVTKETIKYYESIRESLQSGPTDRKQKDGPAYYA
jgi:SpoVK/Ycf46/Vps4 family AAA+-type ATPase